MAQSGPGLAALMADAYKRAEGDGGGDSSDDGGAGADADGPSEVSPERRSSGRKPVPSAKAVASGQAWLAEEKAQAQYSASVRRSGSARSKGSRGRGASPMSVDDQDELNSPAKRRKRKRELFPESPSDSSLTAPRHMRKTHTTAASSDSAMDVLSAAAVRSPAPEVSTGGLDALLAAMGGAPAADGAGKQSDGRRNLKPTDLRRKGHAMTWATSQTGLLDLEDDKLDAALGLHHLLLTRRARRWCMYEWFYSSIDVLYFKQNEFQLLLNDLGLFRINQLSRTEWSYIRSKMGKPRRLSQAYLQQESQKLKQYREEVRNHHSGKASTAPPSAEMELYLDEIPAPINVGTPVVARHPKDGELYSGKVLLKDNHRYRIQFDDQGLGQPLLIDDVNVMPQPGAHANRWRRRTPREPDAASSYTRDSAELLEKKKAIVIELRAAVEQTAKIKSEGGEVPDKLSLQRETLQHDLVELDERIKALHEQVAQMQVYMPTMLLAPNLLAEQCLAAAAQLVNDQWTPKASDIPKEANEAEVARLQELVSGCLGVLFGLHDTGRRPQPDVQQVLQHILQKVKPLSALSAPEFHGIEATIKMIVASNASMGGYPAA